MLVVLVVLLVILVADLLGLVFFDSIERKFRKPICYIGTASDSGRTQGTRRTR